MSVASQIKKPFKVEIKDNGVSTYFYFGDTAQECLDWTTSNGFDILPYTYDVIDRTAELLDINIAQESKEAIALCNKLKEDIRALNKKKIRDGVWDATTFNNFLTSVPVAQAERALNNGSLGSYKSVVSSITGFYTVEENQNIINQIDAHIAKWAALGII
jgi:hypothetical protein